MAIAEVSVVPIGTGSTSISEIVARAVKVVESSGLYYELTPMGTIIEGSLDEIFEVVKKMHESCFVEGVARVLSHVRIDDRRDKRVRAEEKVISVKEKLGNMEDPGP
ncbi:MTH1187 family thiamine-binding protein [Thermodesulforhabdus norvegica]|uniref:Uncharacterized protein, MTH1187 family n=1 Tax=Thermodesulforhabdus norvegica TaxID=39841 RepID=A0A1I4SJ68_9BACT|nr:MTH1187 family thiamine-binding protein [Thermodesulforhabdus norvegica]SFM64536.1 uncharacterized protein, MTH1187 family [Thermodesulforhabdus norvegica]